MPAPSLFSVLLTPERSLLSLFVILAPLFCHPRGHAPSQELSSSCPNEVRSCMGIQKRIGFFVSLDSRAIRLLRRENDSGGVSLSSRSRPAGRDTRGSKNRLPSAAPHTPLKSEDTPDVEVVVDLIVVVAHAAATGVHGPRGVVAAVVLGRRPVKILYYRGASGFA